MRTLDGNLRQKWEEIPLTPTAQDEKAAGILRVAVWLLWCHEPILTANLMSSGPDEVDGL